MDLVAAAPEEELLDRHMTDSLTVLKTGLLTGGFRGGDSGGVSAQTDGKVFPRDGEALLPGAGTMIDVGTGAGFPGMALALALPQAKVTLLDSQRKRLLFLEEVIARTGAENVSLIHARAEDGARRPDLRDRFDLAVARALAPMNVLCEYLLPYVKPGGRALCWKGPSLRQEKESGQKAARLLGARMLQPVPAPVAGRDWDHVILPLEEISGTPKQYPRKAGTPKASPLGGS